MAKATAKKKSSGKPQKSKPAKGEVTIVATAHDPFNGFVHLKTDGNDFWAEHERKGISSDAGSQEDAQTAFDEFVNDSVF